MTKRKMYLRMITTSLMRRRSRMLVALLAIAVGATILSGLVTIYYDVPRQMGAQFRNYGANMILLPASSDTPLNEDTLDRALTHISESKLVGVAPYRYENVTINELPVRVAATDMEGAKKTSPYWQVSGEWPSKPGEVMVGKNKASGMAFRVGDTLEIVYTPETESDDPQVIADSRIRKTFTVSGILDTGGSEEDYFFIPLEDIEELTGVKGVYDVAELSISATQTELTSMSDAIRTNVPEVSARAVKRVAQSETTVLTKLQALVFLVTVVVLLLTMICVATTMMAVATERRKEIALRKALGASNRNIIREFMGEGLLLGGIGGIIGSGLGFAFAQIVSMKVFNSSIEFQPLILPATIIISVIVTGLACLLPVRSATEVEPAIVLKGE